MAILAAKFLGPAPPRYGGPADVARLAGLSTRTVRRRIAAGAVPCYRVGRRVLVAFADVDQFIRSRRAPTMATVHRPRAEAEAPYVPPIAAEERARRNRAAIALLDAWETEGDEHEQRETLAVLAEALGPRRIASSRALFP